MSHATLKNLSRRAVQSAALLLAFAPLCFGGEPVASSGVQSLGEMVVTAKRVPPLMGHLVVTAPRGPLAYVSVAPLGEMTVTATASVTVADLGTMTVSAPRETVLASTGAFFATR